jgi:hypothetical protein
VVWVAVFCLLVLRERTESSAVASRALLLASSIAGLSYAFKAQLFLLFGGAYALAVVAALRRLGARTAVLNLFALAGAAAALFVLSRGPGATPTVEWRPGLFVERYVVPNLLGGGTEAERALGAALAGDGVSATLLGVVVVLARVVAFSPFVAAFLARSSLRFGGSDLPSRVALLSFVVALPMGYGLSIVSVYRESSPFEFRQAVHGLALLGSAISVITARAALSGRVQDPGAAVLTLTLLGSALAAPSLGRGLGDVAARSGVVLSTAEQCALVALREQAPAEALVIAARPGPQRVNRHAVVAGFGGRRSVLEVFGPDVDRGNDRETDIKRLFQTPSPGVARRILDRYGVDYVLESPESRLKTDPGNLSVVFEREGHRLYRVAASPARSAAPGPRFSAEDVLRCPSP